MQLKRSETVLLSLIALLACTCVVEGRYRRQAVATSESDGCLDDEYTCEGDFSCIPIGFRCDDDNDCPGGDDERNCPPCDDDEYTCGNESNFTCIPIYQRCDHDTDCPNGDDERNCTQYRQRTCNSRYEYTCEGGTYCIPFRERCNEVPNCPQGEDEWPGCPLGCSPVEISCNPSECIRNIYWCDGTPNCSGGEDEANCPN